MDEKLFVNIHILLVDDDATSLAVVSAMLRLCKYKVETLRNPIEALETLRARKGFFDLVVTDLHMPQMNGLQLQKKVMQEFKLPVIMMSADEKPSVILKSLEEGVAFYMVKPISLDDVKHVWQYAITPKNIIVKPNQTTTTSIIQPRLSIGKSSSSLPPCSTTDETIKLKPISSSKFKNNKAKKNSNIGIRKTKVIWTNSLHNRFLQAIKLIGLHKAVPKKILEFMNVPGLTRENVASHLQKYRIFLKRVAEKGVDSMNTYSDYTLQRSKFSNSSHFQSPNSYNFLEINDNKQLIMPPLNYQCSILEANNNLSHLISLPNPTLEGLPIENSLPYLENQSHSTLLTLYKPNFPCHGFVSSSTQDDQNFVSMENENPKYLSNGTGRTTIGGDQIICLDHLNNGGSRLDVNDSSYQNLPIIFNRNMEEINGSFLVSLEEEEEGKVTNENIIAYGEIGDEHQNCFDVLSEIFMGHDHNQNSLRREEMDIVSDIWNGIEMGVSAKQDNVFQLPSGLSAAQGWDDDDILELLFGDGPSSS